MNEPQRGDRCLARGVSPGKKNADPIPSPREGATDMQPEAQIEKGAPKGSHSVLVGFCYYGSNRNAMIKA